MAFADALAAQLTGAYKPTCTMKLIVASLSKADAKQLADALADRSIPGAAIARALRADKHKVSDDTVRRHRNLECECAR